MKYFVTGATGFVGSHVTRQLVEAGHQVVAVVRNPAKAAELADLGVAIHQGDVTEKESMRRPMQGVDGVFHIAGWYKIGVKDKSDGEKINVQGTRNVLELMKELDTFVDALHLAEKITGVPAPRIQVTPELMKMMAATMGVVEKVVPVPPDYSSEYLRISAGVTYIGSNAKAKGEWGYDPRPLEEGLTETLRHEMRLLGMI